MVLFAYRRNVMEHTTTTRLRPETTIGTAVKALMVACGFDNSESGTEAFLSMLLRACRVVEKNITQSHKEGLCWDAQHDLAGQLDEAVGISKMLEENAEDDAEELDEMYAETLAEDEDA
jgi:hypothetical protein